MAGGNPKIMPERAPSELVVVLVTRPTSGVGRRMESLLAQLQLRTRSRLRVRILDADAQPELVGRLAVSEIPSIVVVKDRRPVEVIGGRATFAEIERAVWPFTHDAAA